MKTGREIVGAATTKEGLVLIIDYPFPDKSVPAGYNLFLWSPSKQAPERLEWGDEFGKNIFTNPDGTKLARFRTRQQPWTSNYSTTVEIYNLEGKKLSTIIPTNRKGKFLRPTIMDSRDNVYVVAQNQEQTKRLLAVFQSDTQTYEVFQHSELLLDRSQGAGQPQKPVPVLLNDGATVATYIRNEKDGGRYCIQYYCEGKLVKTVNDPVPNDAGEARLAITSDGKGVLTQVVSGKKKGLVKVWDVETGKSFEILTLPLIAHIFPWVQGKYAPIWCSSDGRTYEAGLLEITRTNVD